MKAENKKIYDEKLNNLISSFNFIIGMDIPEADKSGKIMELLRKECVFVNEKYLKSANTKKYATLDPDDDGLKFSLDQEDNVYEWYPIFGNSFGPFYPKEYFKEGNLRILWILKEPYIEKESWVKGDRGGHNQAKEYNKMSWNEIKSGEENNSTIANIIEFAKIILEKYGIYYKDDEEGMKQVMNHICILEANHFPGLAFNSIDSKEEYMLEWTDFNKALSKRLIEFYAGIIVCGHFNILSLMCEGTKQARENLFNFLKTKSFEKLNTPGGYPDTTMLGSKIAASDNLSIEYTTQKKDKRKRDVSMIIDGEGRHWFGCDHPSYGSYKNEDYKQKFADWIFNKSNDNGATESSEE